MDDFGGLACFGGKVDELVLLASHSESSQFFTCVSTQVHFLGSNIYIWHRDYGTLLHSIQNVGFSMTCIAWNRVLPGLNMFAVGGDDGRVQVWAARTQQTLHALTEVEEPRREDLNTP